MTNLIEIIFLIFIMSSVVILFRGGKVNRYVKKKKGILVSSEFLKNSFNIINVQAIIKYKDQNNNLREVRLIYFGFFSSFVDDKIVEYFPSSPEYEEQKREKAEKKLNELKKQISYDNRAVEFNEVDYKLKSQEVLTIKQEYSNPNIGEFAYINNRPAPNGKYKIGLFTYIHVENGRILDIK